MTHDPFLTDDDEGDDWMPVHDGDGSALLACMGFAALAAIFAATQTVRFVWNIFT